MPPGAPFPYLEAVKLRPDPVRLAVPAALVAAALLWLARFRSAPDAPPAPEPARENPAYAAVASDDKANAGRPPLALALPLRSGGPPEARGREGAAARVRLLHDPAAEWVPKQASLNQGAATDEQLDGLLARGVRHVLFHANVFAADDSPFPAAATLRALTGHPRLAALADDGQVFAFRILPKHPVEHVPHANWPATLYAAGQQWHWNPPLEIAQGESAPLLLPMPVQPAPGLRFLLRLAPGSAQPLLTPPARGGTSSVTHPVEGLPDWLQADLPSPTGAFVHALSGAVRLEHALLTAGELPAPGADGNIHVPPALLFHQGHSAPGAAPAFFLPETVPAGRALWGPDLPFPPGVYDIAISYSANLPAGVLRLLTLPDRTVLAEAELAVETNAYHAHGQTLGFHAIAIGASPLRFELDYNGRANLMLHDIVLRPATLTLRPAAP